MPFFALVLYAYVVIFCAFFVCCSFCDLLEIRKKYFEERSLYSLFRNLISEISFDFLREIGVFYKI